MFVVAAATPRATRAQDADPLPPKRDSTTYPSLGAGEFSPATGYDIIKTQRGSLNISSSRSKNNGCTSAR